MAERFRCEEGTVLIRNSAYPLGSVRIAPSGTIVTYDKPHGSSFSLFYSKEYPDITLNITTFDIITLI